MSLRVFLAIAETVLLLWDWHLLTPFNVIYLIVFTGNNGIVDNSLNIPPPALQSVLGHPVPVKVRPRS